MRILRKEELFRCDVRYRRQAVTGLEIININRQRLQFIQTVQIILLAGIVFSQLADDRKIELINQLMTIQIQQRAAVIGNRVTARLRVPAQQSLKSICRTSSTTSYEAN